jgi:drug/metabolite transporter (DMT)-like permease
MMTRSLRADFFLLVVTLIWGVTFPLVTEAVRYMSPFLFVTLRFSCAAVFLLFWVFKKLGKTSAPLLMAGMILGILNAAVYLFQTFGMQTVDADTAAFVAAAGVVFVPFISHLMKLTQVKFIEYIGTFVCLYGLYVLTGADLDQLHAGEFWILLASVFWAIGVCYLQKVTPNIKELNLLAFYQIVFTLPLAVSMTSIDSHVSSWPPILWIAIIYTGILATALVFILQVRYQKETTATHAAIIYSLEPVLASIFAIYINNEALTWHILAGGAIVLLSIALIEVIPVLIKDRRKHA